jgi:hypothetical protein
MDTDMTQGPTPRPAREATDLERRVLAHERILQSLIAHMSRAEPGFLDHLRKTFVEPMETARREQGYTATDDYAKAFIRAITALGDTERGLDRRALGRLHPKIDAGNDATIVSASARPADRIQTRERNGVWSVTVDGVFHGDYHRREQAEAAAALARLGAG